MIDSVTVQILRNRIGCLMEEMAHHFFRSGYSTIVRESRDFSCVIVDARGRLIVAPPMFYHAMAYQRLIARIVEIYGCDGLADGDIFVCNHPYEGAMPHASDMATIAPIIADGKLIGFSGAIAHKADIGGAVPGSSWGQATEMFQEGLLMPPMRLYRAGKVLPDVERVIAANSRQADLVLGDLRGQIGATRIGLERMKALANEHGADMIVAALDAMSDASAREFSAALALVPDGTSEAEGFMEGDGRAAPVRMHLRVSVKAGRITFDFTGSDAQRNYPVNMRRALTEACCFHALIGLIDPNLRYSDAAKDVVEILTAPASVCDAQPPMPCSSYMKACQRLIDIIYEALNPFFPQRAAAAAGGSGGTITIAWGAGARETSGAQHEIFGSAYGGGQGRDGASGTTVHLSNIYVTPVEIVETEFPCRVRAFELIPNSGGDGEYRGGLSFRREYEALQPAMVLYRGDRAIYPAKGYGGGKDGRPSRFLVNPDGADEKAMPASCRVDLKAGERFRVEAAGGGGFGDAAQRSRDARDGDSEDGYVA
jgi:N-methylhydantoinase B